MYKLIVKTENGTHSHLLDTLGLALDLFFDYRNTLICSYLEMEIMHCIHGNLLATYQNCKSKLFGFSFDENLWLDDEAFNLIAEF